MKMLFPLLCCVLSWTVLLPSGHAQDTKFLDPLPFFGNYGDGSVRPGDQLYLTTNSAQRGLSYNPLTGYLVFVDRASGTASSTFSGSIYILDWMTGDAVGTLNPNGIPGD